MLGQSNFHCNFKIQRQGHKYGLKNDSLMSTIELFLQKTQAPFFTIGSSRDAYIHINCLAPNHATCIFADNDLIVHAGETMFITRGTQKQKIEKGDRITFNLSEALGGFTWKMTFDEKTRIAGKITEEQEILPHGTTYHLESQYGLLKKIDEGKSSLIFKTQDEKVLKILRPGFVREKKSTARRFINAARRYQRISEPEFLPIYDIVYHRDYNLCYVVSDNFQGESLKNYLGRRGILSVEEAIPIVREIAKKLCILESYGYVCRNLNPSNIIRNSDGELRITSFFLLKTDINMTVMHARMIIPNYTAPEQISDPSSVDILSDIFSLGAIFYTLVTGEPPFKANTSVQYEKSVTTSEAISPRDIYEAAPHVPMDVCETMACLLAPDKNERPGPHELVSLLESGEGEKDILSESLMDLIDAECENLEVTGISPEPVNAESDTFDFINESDLESLDEEQEKRETTSSEPISSELFSESALHLIDTACKDALQESDYEMETPMASPQMPQHVVSTAPLDLLKSRASPLSPSYVALLEKVDREESIPHEKTTCGYCIAIVAGPEGTEFIEYNFTGDHTLTIGREGDFRVIHDTQVSRKHVELQVIKDKCMLIDLGSINGTYVNRQKITREEITPGTRFSIADTTLLFKRSKTGTILENPKEELSDEDLLQLKSLKITSVIPRAALKKASSKKKRVCQKTETVPIPEAVSASAPPKDRQATVRKDMTASQQENATPKKRGKLFLAITILLVLAAIACFFLFANTP